jgi:uncharacterized protein (TIGR03435 family)
MRRMLSFKAVLWTAILCQSSVLFCQGTSVTPENSDAAGSTYTPHMSFDVAAIHESRSGHMSYYDFPPKTSYFHAERVSPFGLIAAAYDVDLMSLLKNVPDWAMTTKYDVTAKSDPSAEEALAKLSDRDFQAEKEHMLRGLLADRFKLQIHSEIRQSTIYELVTTKRTASLMTPVHGDIARTVSTCDAHPSPKGTAVESKGCPLSILLNTLHQALDGDVVDHTGLSGMYAYHLGWGPSPQIQHEGQEYYPKILDAIREQLGLEVKKTQGPVTFWVVDHIERPTPN